MGVKIAREKNEHHLLKVEPQPLKEFRPTNFEADYKRKFDELAEDENEDDSDDSDESSATNKAAVNDDDEWSNVGDDRKTRRTKKRAEEKQAHFMKKFGHKIAAKKAA